MDNAQILTEMGFKLITAGLWRHDRIGVIEIDIEDGLDRIANSIFNNGYSKCQKNMRDQLGIK